MPILVTYSEATIMPSSRTEYRALTNGVREKTEIHDHWRIPLNGQVAGSKAFYSSGRAGIYFAKQQFPTLCLQ